MNHGWREVERAVLIVKPKQPFLDWIQSLDDLLPDLTLDYLRRDCNAYLIPVVENDEEAQRAIRRYHERLFENELYGWSTDDSDWPKRRGLKTFQEWFDVEVHSMVVDLG